MDTNPAPGAQPHQNQLESSASRIAREREEHLEEAKRILPFDVRFVDVALGGIRTTCSSFRDLLGDAPEPASTNCWLWLAEYAPAPTRVPPQWPHWTLWQPTDGHCGAEPHNIPGIGPCDRNQFNGDEARPPVAVGHGQLHHLGRLTRDQGRSYPRVGSLS
jgi:hypothetical protein